MKPILPALGLASVLVASSCAPDGRCEPVWDAEDEREVTVGARTFVRTVVDAQVCGPAYAAAGDLDGDGRTDLLVSALGPRPDGRVPPGTLTAYVGTEDGFSRRVLIDADEGLRFPNRPTLSDLDGDGDVDVVLPLGFFPCSFEPLGSPCGGLLLLTNDGDGSFARRALIEPGDPRFFHGVEVADLDGDGIDDLVTVLERRDAPWEPGRAALMTFSGLGGGQFAEPRTRVPGLGTFPSVIDVDGDGDLDVGGAEFLGEERASYAWVENLGSRFERHPISRSHGPGFGLTFVPDLLGDGRLAAVGTNHTNPVRRPEDPAPAVTLFTPRGRVEEPWKERTLFDDFTPEDRSGQFAPGLFGVGDIDGDGRRDVLVSGDGDARVLALLQQEDAAFDAVELERGLGQAGGMLIADLEGDGANELVVTGYEDHVVLLYRSVR